MDFLPGVPDQANANHAANHAANDTIDLKGKEGIFHK